MSAEPVIMGWKVFAAIFVDEIGEIPILVMDV